MIYPLRLHYSSGEMIKFDFQKFGYKVGADSVYYRYTDNAILQKDEAGGTIYRVSSRQYNPVYVSIPLMLLFRTDPIGDWKYFGKFGLRNSFLVSQKINDTGVDLSAPTAVKENTNMKSLGETFFYKDPEFSHNWVWISSENGE